MINRLIRKWLLAVIGNVLSLMVIAQGSGSISGTVIDKNTQQPLAGVSATLNPGGKGTTTDGKGAFR
ncbi:MAG: carboxypeptidase-like regulatory domain-containing protein, partial [Chitinophagaceae bacterium]|nr:carboxypeptidase-like regulatory domain-containing protein [Chitinophagaceae bacterium]